MGKGLMLMMAGALLTSTLMLSTNRDIAQETTAKVVSYEEDLLAREISRSAMNLALAKVQQDFSAAENNVNYTNAAYQNGNFDATVTRHSSTSLTVNVTGRYGSAQHQRSTTVKEASPLDAALLVQAPASDVTLTGTTFLIDGHDTRPPQGSSSANSSYDTHGIKANLSDVRDDFRTALGSSRVTQVKGLLGNGDIVSGPMEPAEFLDELFNEAVSSNDLEMTGNTIISSSVTYGTANNPQVIYINGDLTVSGTLEGFGLLAVAGNLTISGNFTWEGVVMARNTQQPNEEDLYVTYGGNSTIYGALVLLQGSAAFQMPVTGTLRLSYLYSSAGLKSAVHIHPHGQSDVEVFAKGSNRNGDLFEPWEVQYEAGQQMNFFIRVYYRGSNTPAYDHYARGHESSAGIPYATVDRLTDLSWQLNFEDIDEYINSGFGTNIDWDYNDQVVQVEVIPSDTAAVEGDAYPWWDNLPLAGGSTNSSSVTGSTLHFTMGTGTKIYYSAEAISRLISKITLISQRKKLVVASRWVQ